MRPLIFVAALIFAGTVAGISSAATLGLDTKDPSISSSSAVISYLDFDPDGDLSLFGAEVDSATGVAPSGFTEIGFGFGYSKSDPTGFFFGGFDVFDENGEFLSGDLIAVGFTTDVIELQFNVNDTGSAASAFGSSVLAIISFADPLGDDPFSSLSDAVEYGATVTISSIAPIPLPFGLPLLLSGVGAFVFVRKRQTVA